jgi:hypothetical protein
MSWTDLEVVLVSLAAMLSPTTLSFSILALVLSERPLRTGWWFYLGALTATLGVGVAAAYVVGDVAASRHPSSPKTWVAILDVVIACVIFAYVVKERNRPLEPQKVESMVTRMNSVASSPALAIFGAGALLANAGAFMALAAKAISETNPSTLQFMVEWLFFALVSLLPLAIALVLLLIAKDWAERLLARVRDWLIANVRTVAALVLVLLALVLLRNGISGLA